MLTNLQIPSLLLNVRLAHESCLASSTPSVCKTERNGKRRSSREGGLGRVGSLPTRPKTSLVFFSLLCYRTEAQYSTLFYWQNAWNRIAILGRYIILIFIWMDIIICCMQKIPRSVWTRKVSCGARLSDTWKGDQTKKMQTEFTLKNTDLIRLQPINTLNPLPLRVTDNISPNIITPETKHCNKQLKKILIHLIFPEISIGNVNRKVWRTWVFTFGCIVLINSENQFIFSFAILVKKIYLQERWVCFPC